MYSSTIALTILSSSVLSGIIGAAMSGYFSLHTKQAEYANDYYKSVVARRLQAYEDVEKLITNFKMAVVDDDMAPYHLVFAGSESDPGGLYGLMMKILSQSLWLSDGIFELTRELNVFIFENGPMNGESWIPTGKKHYVYFGSLRTKLERVHSLDMLSLHDVPKFLKNKKPSDIATPLHRPQAN